MQGEKEQIRQWYKLDGLILIEKEKIEEQNDENTNLDDGDSRNDADIQSGHQKLDLKESKINGKIIKQVEHEPFQR